MTSLGFGRLARSAGALGLSATLLLQSVGCNRPAPAGGESAGQKDAAASACASIEASDVELKGGIVRSISAVPQEDDSVVLKVAQTNADGSTQQGYKVVFPEDLPEHTLTALDDGSALVEFADGTPSVVIVGEYDENSGRTIYHVVDPQTDQEITSVSGEGFPYYGQDGSQSNDGAPAAGPQFVVLGVVAVVVIGGLISIALVNHAVAHCGDVSLPKLMETCKDMCLPNAVQTFTGYCTSTGSIAYKDADGGGGQGTATSQTGCYCAVSDKAPAPQKGSFAVPAPAAAQAPSDLSATPDIDPSTSCVRRAAQGSPSAG
jgi:hypothetical protein